MPLSKTLSGTWRLLNRETVPLAGGPIDPPSLGEDPLGLLVYDRAGNFSAQFMKRERSARRR